MIILFTVMPMPVTTSEAKALLGEDPSTEINAVRERAYGSEYFNAHKNEVAYPNDKGSFYNDNPFEGAMRT